MTVLVQRFSQLMNQVVDVAGAKVFVGFLSHKFNDLLARSPRRQVVSGFAGGASEEHETCASRGRSKKVVCAVDANLNGIIVARRQPIKRVDNRANFNV